MKIGEQVDKLSQQMGAVSHKVEDTFHFPHRENKYQRYLHLVQHFFLYVAVFLAGYITAVVQAIIK